MKPTSQYLNNDPSDFRFLRFSGIVLVGSEDVPAAIISSLQFEPRRVVRTAVHLTNVDFVDLQKVRLNCNVDIFLLPDSISRSVEKKLNHSAIVGSPVSILYNLHTQNVQI